MKRAAFVSFVAFTIASPVLSSDAVDHYAPRPSDTPQDTVANFTEYNPILSGILARDALSPNDMEDIHQLT